jgi:septum formation protein
LSAAGYDFRVVPPAEDVECGVCSESGPAGLVAELAYRKAAVVSAQLRNDLSNADSQRQRLILAADTVAECDGLILGKPRDEEDAREMLTRLSGREHRVLTGVCLWPLLNREGQSLTPLPSPIGRGDAIVRVAVTRLRMDRLSATQLDDYLSSHEWEGKAGAFGYQDRLGWVHIVEGSESNVVGLPMELLAEMLVELQ